MATIRLGALELNEDLSGLREPESGKELARDGDALVYLEGGRYPIVAAIPRFVSADNYAADFGDQWKRFPKSQLDSHTGLPLSRDRLSRCFRGHLERLDGKRVLEAGSGAGRFTEVLLAEGAILDSFDYSNAVEANAVNNGDKRFTLVQADIRHMPFAKGAYDYVVCLGVLQHTPDTEQSIAKLWEMVAPGGVLVIDHYAWNLWLRLPPPLGNAEKLYRQFILRLPREKRFLAVRKLVDLWFPLYWKWRHSKWALRALARISGVRFYFGSIDLKTRERHYEWSLLDTHDGLTDAFKRFRNVAGIKATLESLGADDIHAWKGGNGVEAWCRKAQE